MEHVWCHVKGLEPDSNRLLSSNELNMAGAALDGCLKHFGLWSLPSARRSDQDVNWIALLKKEK